MKKIVCVFLALLMLFALTACNGDEMQSKIDELEAKLNEQTQIMEKLIEDGDALKQEKDRLVGELAGMEEARQALEELVGSLEEENNQQQEFIDTMLNELVVEKIDNDHYKRVTRSQPIANISIGYKFIKILYERNNVKIKIYSGPWIDYMDPDDEYYSKFVAEITATSGYLYGDGERVYHQNRETVCFIENYYDYCREHFEVSSVDEFTYSKEITLSQELFVDDMGFIRFYAKSLYLNIYNEYENYEEIEIIIYYKSVGDYIVLSTEPF